MKTVGNDLVRRQLHHNRKWYIGLGVLLTIFGLVLLASLPFATLSAVFVFGVLMMVGGILHLLAAFKIFEGGFRWFWALFGVLYLVAAVAYAIAWRRIILPSPSLLKQNWQGIG